MRVRVTKVKTTLSIFIDRIFLLTSPGFTRVSLHEDPPQFSSYYSAEPDTIPGNGTPGTSTTTNATGSQSTTGDSCPPSYSYIELRRLPKLKISPWILLIVVRFFHTLWYALPCYLALSADTAVKWPFSSPPPPRWLLYAVSRIIECSKAC